jgi:hypothetical protein
MSKWQICCNCNGEGCHSKKLGVIDPSDWDNDSLDDYMNGGYDSICELCDGTGKVLTENNKPIKYYSTDDEFYRNREGGY